MNKTPTTREEKQVSITEETLVKAKALVEALEASVREAGMSEVFVNEYIRNKHGAEAIRLAAHAGSIIRDLAGQA
jgi:hypothetical protein